MIFCLAWTVAFVPIAVLASGEPDTSLLIETSTGVVKGKTVRGYTEKDARAFFGIPYAEPPVGKLRFRPPVSISSWTGILDATRDPTPCYQQYTKESLKLSKRLGRHIRRPWSEDCLTLSVWTQPVASPDSPVFVTFHGGDFLMGTGVHPYMDLSTFAVEADIVQISVNYRLGAFGFLSLGVPDFPGNLGLMDQQLALKWVHSNVDKFGGKPEAIILVGYDAGAASIGHQMIQVDNEGLFKTGILVNGSPTCSWAWQTKETAVVTARLLSESLGCNNSNLMYEIECLQNVHPDDMLDANRLDDGSTKGHFKPNVDGWFIKEPPVEALKAGRIGKFNIAVAVSEKADSLKFLSLNEDKGISDESARGLTAKDFQEAIQRVGLAQTGIEHQVIRDWYLQRNCPGHGNEIRHAAIEAYTDGLTTCCINQFLDDATENGRLALKFVYGIPDSTFPDWIGSHSLLVFSMATGDSLNPKNGHGDQVRNVTLQIMINAKAVYRKKFVELKEVLPLYNSDEQAYTLRTSKLHSLKNHRREECVLWNEVLPAMRKRRGSCSNN